MINKLTVTSNDYPARLQQIASPPKALYHVGAPLRDLLRPAVAIVGSRNVTVYGRQVTLQLARDLANQGIVIISGLALGVDALAHKGALEVGGLAIAVLPGPLENIAPRTNHYLAQQILASGGALVSEYGATDLIFKQNFIARNRLVSGLSDGVLITEAAEQSGAIHTADFALDQGKHVMAVPGNITSPSSVGANNLIKAFKTFPVTSYTDVLHVLELQEHSTPAREIRGRNTNEQKIIDLLAGGTYKGDELLAKSELSASDFARVLTGLEITSKIRPIGANNWALY